MTKSVLLFALSIIYSPLLHKAAVRAGSSADLRFSQIGYELVEALSAKAHFSGREHDSGNFVPPGA